MPDADMPDADMPDADMWENVRVDELGGAARPRGLRHVEPVMGTVVTIDVRDPTVGPEAIATVTDWLHHVDATFSTYRHDSAISLLDRGEITLAGCPDTVRWVLDRCDTLASLTGGYFDVRCTGRLDPSALVKGWSIDQADQILRAAGSRSHCLNAGGDVRTYGLAEPDRPWRVGVVDPLDRTRLATVAVGVSFAVATSGTAERGLHVLNPITGLRARDLVSVTVVGPSLADADAYSTAALAMGHAAREWLARLDGFEAFVVTATNDRWWTDGWAAASGAALTGP